MAVDNQLRERVKGLLFDKNGGWSSGSVFVPATSLPPFPARMIALPHRDSGESPGLFSGITQPLSINEE